MKQTNNLLKIYSTLPELQIERQHVECRGNLSSAGCAVIYIATDADCLPFGRIQRLAWQKHVGYFIILTDVGKWCIHITNMGGQGGSEYVKKILAFLFYM